MEIQGSNPSIVAPGAATDYAVAINVIFRLSPVFAYEALFVLLLNTDTSGEARFMTWMPPYREMILGHRWMCLMSP